MSIRTIFWIAGSSAEAAGGMTASLLHDADWSGNVYDFYRKAQDMLTDGLPVPFELGSDMHRLSDTPQHKAIREGLVNALVHADCYGRAGIVLVRHPDRIEISNPGTLRLPVSVIERGGISDPRSLALFTMFNLVGLSEKAGSGFDVLRQAADWAHAEAPSLKETIEPDRVVLTMYVSSKADVGNAGNDAGSIAGHDDESMDLTRTERALLDGMRANPDAASQEMAAGGRRQCPAGGTSKKDSPRTWDDKAYRWHP
jgi:predicted HTH transcriptional regulator